MKEAKHQHLDEEFTVSLQPVLVELLNCYDLGMYISYFGNMLSLYVTLQFASSPAKLM